MRICIEKWYIFISHALIHSFIHEITAPLFMCIIEAHAIVATLVSLLLLLLNLWDGNNFEIRYFWKHRGWSWWNFDLMMFFCRHFKASTLLGDYKPADKRYIIKMRSFHSNSKNYPQKKSFSCYCIFHKHKLFNHLFINLFTVQYIYYYKNLPLWEFQIWNENFPHSFHINFNQE